MKLFAVALFLLGITIPWLPKVAADGLTCGAYQCSAGTKKTSATSIQCNADAACCERGLSALGFGDVFRAYKNMFTRCPLDNCAACTVWTPDTINSATDAQKCQCLREVMWCSRLRQCDAGLVTRTCSATAAALSAFAPTFTCDAIANCTAVDTRIGGWSVVYNIMISFLKGLPAFDGTCSFCTGFTDTTWASASNPAKCQCIQQMTLCAEKYGAPVDTIQYACDVVKYNIVSLIQPSFTCDHDCGGAWRYIYLRGAQLLSRGLKSDGSCSFCKGYSIDNITSASAEVKMTCLEDMMKCAVQYSCDPGEITNTCNAINGKIAAYGYQLPRTLTCSLGWTAVYLGFTRSISAAYCPTPKNTGTCVACAGWTAQNISSANMTQVCQCMQEWMACSGQYQCDPANMYSTCSSLVTGIKAVMTPLNMTWTCPLNDCYPTDPSAPYVAWKNFLGGCPANNGKCAVCAKFSADNFSLATDAEKCTCMKESVNCALQYGCSFGSTALACLGVKADVVSQSPSFATTCDVGCGDGWGDVYNTWAAVISHSSCVKRDGTCSFCQGWTNATIHTASAAQISQCWMDGMKCAIQYQCDPPMVTGKCNELKAGVASVLPNYTWPVDCSGGYQMIYSSFLRVFRSCPIAYNESVCSVCAGYTADSFATATDAAKCQCMKQAMKCAPVYQCDPAAITGACSGAYLQGLKTALPNFSCDLDCGNTIGMCGGYVCASGKLKSTGSLIQANVSCTDAQCCVIDGTAFVPPSISATSATLAAAVQTAIGVSPNTAFAGLSVTDRLSVVNKIVSAGTKVIQSDVRVQQLIDIKDVANPKLALQRNASSPTVYMRGFGDCRVAIVVSLPPSSAVTELGITIPSLPSNAGSWITDVITITRMAENGSIVSTSPIKFDVPCVNGSSKIGVCHIDTGATTCGSVSSITASADTAGYCTVTHTKTSSFIAYSVTSTFGLYCASYTCPANYVIKNGFIVCGSTACDDATCCQRSAAAPPNVIRWSLSLFVAISVAFALM